MNEYFPFIAIAGMGVILYLGTLLWTSRFAAKKDGSQESLPFPKQSRRDEHDLASASHR
jgi:hypothetical protein